jgi:hypothetical protein
MVKSSSRTSSRDSRHRQFNGGATMTAVFPSFGFHAKNVKAKEVGSFSLAWPWGEKFADSEEQIFRATQLTNFPDVNPSAFGTQSLTTEDNQRK